MSEIKNEARTEGLGPTSGPKKQRFTFEAEFEGEVLAGRAARRAPSTMTGGARSSMPHSHHILQCIASGRRGSMLAGKGQQKVTVEHVHVHSGDQALWKWSSPPG